jgi:hypothetical protein
MQKKHTVTVEFESYETPRKSDHYLVAVGVFGPGITKVRVSRTWAERQALLDTHGIEVAS